MQLPKNSASLATKLERYQRSVKGRCEFVRMQAVLLVLRGSAPRIAGSMLGCTKQASSKWVRIYVGSGDPAALLTKERSGRPLQAVTLCKAMVSQALTLNPLSLGYRVGAWTVPSLQRYLLDHHQIHVGTHTLRRRLHQWSFRYKRPRYVYEEKEPNLAQKKGLSSESCIAGPLQRL